MGKALRDRETQLKKLAFLTAFAQQGTITHAAVEAEIDRSSHYRWLREDATYAADFVEAEGKATDALEREARRRAITGTDKPVFHQGEIVGHIREYSDTLLIFLLKGASPAKYRERIDLTVDVRRTAEQFAASHGLNVDEVLAEADRILAETT